MCISSNPTPWGHAWENFSAPNWTLLVRTTLQRRRLLPELPDGCPFVPQHLDVAAALVYLFLVARVVSGSGGASNRKLHNQQPSPSLIPPKSPLFPPRTTWVIFRNKFVLLNFVSWVRAQYNRVHITALRFDVALGREVLRLLQCILIWTRGVQRCANSIEKVFPPQSGALVLFTKKKHVAASRHRVLGVRFRWCEIDFRWMQF